MRFTKKIVTSDKYNIPNGDGTFREEDVNTDRLRKVAKTSNKMLARGYRIPAPYFHGKDFVPVKIGTPEEGTLRDSKDNAGFWSRFYVKNNALYGELEVERDEDISRVGKSVKETSIYLTPEFRTGHGEVYKDAPMHVACVTHPIEGKSQENFIPENGIALAMSMSVPGGSVGSSVPDLVRLLKESVEVELPDDTNTENILDRLRIALMQKKGNKKVGSLDKPPEGAIKQQAPMLMSFTTKQIDALLATQSVNPETGKPYTKEELEKVGVTTVAPVQDDLVMSHPAFQTQLKANAILMSHLGNVGKESLANRIMALVNSRRITKEYADATLTPMLADLQMSFDDQGKVKPQPLHTILDAFEKMPAPVSLGTKVTGGQDSINKALAMSLGMTVEQMPTELQMLAPDKASELGKNIAESLGLTT